MWTKTRVKRYVLTLADLGKVARSGVRGEIRWDVFVLPRCHLAERLTPPLSRIHWLYRLSLQHLGQDLWVHFSGLRIQI